MSTAKRKRAHQVLIRMTEEEYQTLMTKVSSSGLTTQSFIIDAIMSATVATSEELQELRNVNAQFAEANRQIKKIGVNLNQMAHSINLLCSVLQDDTPDAFRIRKIVDDLMHSNWNETFRQIQNYQKESDAIWQYLRQFVARRRIEPDSGTALNMRSETVRLEKDM